MKLQRDGSKLAFLALVTFGIVVLNIGMLRGDSSIGDYLDLKESRDVLEEAVQKLEHENKQIQLEITRLKKSSAYARKVLRDRYHVTEPGEDIIFFVD